jgi:hypothetical protein
MDVALAADGFGVSEALGHRFDRTHDIALRLRRRRARRQRRELVGGEHGPGPGAEVFRGEILAAGVAHVGVHVRRVDHLPLAAGVDVLEQLVSRNVAAGFDDAREARVVEIDRVPDSALPAELEADGSARDFRVLIAHGRQTERFIVLRVLLVADTDERLLEQLHDGGEHLFSRKPAPAQILFGPRANAAERACERDQTSIFHVVANLAPARMIAILLASARVAADYLNVSERVGADPHLRPRRRDHERLDSMEHCRIGHRSAVGADVSEASRPAGAANARRPRIADVMQLRFLRGSERGPRRRHRAAQSHTLASARTSPHQLDTRDPRSDPPCWRVGIRCRA